MSQKIPKLFSRPLSATDLEKKVMKRIYLREYRDALDRLLVRDQTGSVSVRPDVSKKDARLLKKIAGSVRKNTGFVEKGKLVFIAGAAAVIICFNVFFKDRLVEWAAEAGLEAVFQARADIRDLRFQVLAGRIAFAHLEVADRNQPLQNLFELGATELKVDTVELLKSNVVIENLMSRDIRWGTPRAFSGALPGAPAIAPAAAPAAEADPLAVLSDAGGMGIDILQKEKDNLKSLRTLDRLITEYPATIEKWRKIADDAKPEIESVAASVKATADIKMDAIKTAADAAGAIAAVDKTYQDVTGLKKRLETTLKEFGKDRTSIEADRQQLDREMTADFNRLAALIGNPLGTGKYLAGALLDRLLSRYLGDLAAYARQALAYAEALKPERDKEQRVKSAGTGAGQERAPVERNYGFIRFPGRGAPKFWLKNAAVSVTTPEGLALAGTLSDATGEPDMIGRPIVYTFESTAHGVSFTVEGALDGREKTSARLRAAAALTGQPLKFEEGIPFLNLDTISSTVDGRVEVMISPEGRTAGTIAVTLRRNSFAKGAQPTPVTDLVHEALTGFREIRVAGSYRAPEKGPLELKLDSNLDEALAAVVNKVAAESLAAGKALLKKEFAKLLEAKLGTHAELAKQFVDLDKMFKGDFSSLADADKLLLKKKDDIVKAARKKGLSGLKLPIRL